MIYLFKDIDRSLAVHLYGSSLGKAPFNLVRNKDEGFSFDILIDKKANIKIYGFANIINALIGNEPFSTQADFIDWLCNQFAPACKTSRHIAFAERSKHPLIEFLLFTLLKNAKVELQGEEKTWFDALEAKQKAEIEKYHKANDAPAGGDHADKKAAKAPAQKPVEGKEGHAHDEEKKASKKKDKDTEEVSEEYKKKVFGLRLERLNKGEVILPKEGQENILITSALPYVNNVPHLGNLIGSLLSADVFARYSRLKGNNTVYICGTDMYGTASEIKAILEGKTPGEITDFYHKIHEEIYKDFQIDFDYFGKTATPHHTTIVQDIFNKDLKNGFFQRKTSEEFFSKKYKIGLADRFISGECPFCKYAEAKGDQCDKCGKLLEPEKLVNPKCTLSGEAPEKRKTDHFYLDLTSLEGEIKKFIEKESVAGKWSANSVSISEGWLKTGLLPRSMTRDLNWGVKVPIDGMDHKVFYVWFDAPIGYISITANYTDQWEKWWKNPNQVRLFQFMGKDNVPFHTVMFPASLIATREPYTMLHHISTTEYLNYETGKFSKSQNRGIFGDHVRQMPFIVDCWRYYLLVNRPENSDTQFQWSDFQAKVNQELLQNPGNLLNRVLKFVYLNFAQKTPSAKAEELIP